MALPTRHPEPTDYELSLSSDGAVRARRPDFCSANLGANEPCTASLRRHDLHLIGSHSATRELCKLFDNILDVVGVATPLRDTSDATPAIKITYCVEQRTNKKVISPAHRLIAFRWKCSLKSAYEAMENLVILFSK